MYSEDEIAEAFKLMGLSSAEERETFMKMLKLQPQNKLERLSLFIRTRSGSNEMGLEAKNAKLERTS